MAMPIIKLTKGLSTEVCDCHYYKVKDYKWCASRGQRGGFYAYRFGTLMHRQIIDAPDGVNVDHINGNKLDNRCTNLRLVNQSQNNANQRGAKKGSKSGVKGVYWHNAAGKWCAEVIHNRKKYYLGLYDNLEEARKARNDKAKELHGDYYYPA